MGINDFVSMIVWNEGFYPEDCVVGIFFSGDDALLTASVPLRYDQQPEAVEVVLADVSAYELEVNREVTSCILFFFEGPASVGQYINTREIPDYIVEVKEKIANATSKSYPVQASFYISDGSGQSIDGDTTPYPVDYEAEGSIFSHMVSMDRNAWLESKNIVHSVEPDTDILRLMEQWNESDSFRGHKLWGSLSHGHEIPLDYIIAYAHMQPEECIRSAISFMSKHNGETVIEGDLNKVIVGEESSLEPNWMTFVNVYESAREIANSSNGLARDVMITIIGWSRWILDGPEEGRMGLSCVKRHFDLKEVMYRAMTKPHPWSN